MPGSLFVVGDPKQSLYRFRRADIVTYSTVRSILASYGDELVSWKCSEAIAKRLSLPLKLHTALGADAAGHDLPLDQPAWVCGQVNELIASLPTT